MDKIDNNLHHFWESNFREKQQMWGLTPANSAFKAASLFQQNQFQNILIPGLGYGRNATPFLNLGMEVSGIEISETAISLAKSNFANQLKYIYQGSVDDMPFNQIQYDGIFCYSLIHLFEKSNRRKLIENCFNKLVLGGMMVFVAVSKQFPNFGKGKFLEPNRYETQPGVRLFFYDGDSIQKEFSSYGLISYELVSEEKQIADNKPINGYWYIICKK